MNFFLHTMALLDFMHVLLYHLNISSVIRGGTYCYIIEHAQYELIQPENGDSHAFDSNEASSDSRLNYMFWKRKSGHSCHYCQCIRSIGALSSIVQTIK